MGKICRIKQRTKKYKKRVGFCGNKAEDVNSVNSSVNSVKMDNSTVVETGGNVDGTEHDGVSLSLSLAGNSDNANNESMKNDSASSRKIETILCSTPSSSEPITGYRFMNMELLDTVFSALLCPECMTSPLKLKENMSMKKDLHRTFTSNAWLVVMSINFVIQLEEI